MRYVMLAMSFSWADGSSGTGGDARSDGGSSTDLSDGDAEEESEHYLGLKRTAANIAGIFDSLTDASQQWNGQAEAHVRQLRARYAHSACTVDAQGPSPLLYTHKAWEPRSIYNDVLFRCIVTLPIMLWC